MSTKIMDLTQAAAGGCDDKIGGILKLWIGRYSELATATLTALAGTPAPGYEISAVALSATNGLAEYEFSDNKTAFVNETPGDPGAPVDIQISIQYEGLSAEKIHSLNLLKAECDLIVFVEYKSGSIRGFGFEYTDKATSAFRKCTTPLRAKPGTQSGVGNNDYEFASLEIVGQSKELAYSTKIDTVHATYLNALNFS
ncbi:MAG: hypothetical protein IPM42_22220 [Saprospiraceae bacterium]|nr:hypothetical protein [Saprospiraceae bacterium]